MKSLICTARAGARIQRYAPPGSHVRFQIWYPKTQVTNTMLRRKQRGYRMGVAASYVRLCGEVRTAQAPQVRALWTIACSGRATGIRSGNTSAASDKHDRFSGLETSCPICRWCLVDREGTQENMPRNTCCASSGLADRANMIHRPAGEKAVLLDCITGLWACCGMILRCLSTRGPERSFANVSSILGKCCLDSAGNSAAPAGRAKSTFYSSLLKSKSPRFAAIPDDPAVSAWSVLVRDIDVDFSGWSV